ncbi:MAG: dephospho-CoA kinase [Clostridia bacterium]|nr:dephospho-CoA kinase [Clostridia bacterium]
MKVIGLTGPTGAGKTLVADLMGLPVVNADLVARKVHKDPLVLAKLCRRFGEDVVSDDGSLNRVVLATRAFATRQDTDDLNAIMHPAIFKEIEKELQALKQAGEGYCLLDAPLLFEADCRRLCYTTVGVLAPSHVRQSRIMERDGITEEMAYQRMTAQPDDEYYKERCDHILINNGDIGKLQRDVQTLLKEFV